MRLPGRRWLWIEKREEGYSFGQQYGYLVDYSGGNAFFNSQEEIDASGLQYELWYHSVGARHIDLNGDGLVDERDQAPIGNGAIPRQTYAFGGGFHFKNFDVHLLFQGVGQYAQLMSGDGIWETAQGGMFTALHQNAWTAERYANEHKLTGRYYTTQVQTWS